MNNIIYEIIKSFEVHVDSLEFPIKGKIVKAISGDSKGVYKFELSHYCKQFKDAATIYRPSSIFTDYDNAENKLLNYLREFQPFDVEENPYFK